VGDGHKRGIGDAGGQAHAQAARSYVRERADRGERRGGTGTRIHPEEGECRDREVRGDDDDGIGAVPV